MLHHNLITTRCSFQFAFLLGIRDSLVSPMTMMHMCRHTLLILISTACLLDAALAASGINATYNTLDYVDQLIGSSNGGNVFAGATLPFGESFLSPISPTTVMPVLTRPRHGKSGSRHRFR